MTLSWSPAPPDASLDAPRSPYAHDAWRRAKQEKRPPTQENWRQIDLAALLSAIVGADRPEPPPSP
jgi:hypothetical protein